MRKLIVLSTLVVALAVGATAGAGGWATVGIDPLPDGVEAGGTWNPDITIRQHGQTPLDGLTPVVTICEGRRRDGRVLRDADRRAGRVRGGRGLPRGGELERRRRQRVRGLAAHVRARELVEAPAPAGAASRVPTAGVLARRRGPRARRGRRPRRSTRCGGSRPPATDRFPPRRNLRRLHGVERGGGGPPAGRRRARRAGEERGRARVRGARAQPSANRVPDGLPAHTGRPPTPRTPCRPASSRPGRRSRASARGAVPALAPPHRRERGSQPPPLGREGRGAAAAHRRSRPRGTRPRLPRGPCSGVEQREELLAAVGRLDERDREVVTCRYFLELSEEETATVLGIRRGTVKSRTARALARLREEVEG